MSALAVNGMAISLPPCLSMLCLNIEQHLELGSVTSHSLQSARSLGARCPSSRCPASSASLFFAGLRLRLRPLLERIEFGPLFVEHVRINANLVTVILDANLAHVDLVRALPACGDLAFRAGHATGVLQGTVVGEQVICGLRCGRKSLDGCFVVAVGGGSPFLCTGHWAREANA